MRLTRRETLRLAAASVAAKTLFGPGRASAGPGAKIKVVAFDAFPIFDPRPIFKLVDEIVPVRGGEFSNVWRTRQFEYTWLRTVSGHYDTFFEVTKDALIYAARATKLDLSPEQVGRIMDAYLELKAWPDVRESLDALREAGLRLGFVSNFTAEMLAAAIDSAGLQGYFEHALSTDGVKRFKPDPMAYRMAMDAFGVSQEAILFVPFAGWDAAGAKWFGYETFWVDRLGHPRGGTGRDSRWHRQGPE